MSAATGRSPSGRVVKDQEPRKSGTAGTLKCHPLGAELLSYAVDAETFDTPDAVLDHLHEITWRYCRLSVLGAGLFPLKWGDLRGVEKGRTVFLHKSVPKGWWEDYLELRRKNLDVGTMMARLTLAPYTWTESRRMLEPLGIDRWPYELALKYGMRDGLMCPVGGRWVVGYWSRSVLSKTLAPQVRVMLFMGANFAAIRLQQLLGHNANRFGKRASLTPRELSVLRCQSVGKRVKETAERLELGEETIRSHMKKAAAKLGVHDRTHAVAQALRLHLIP
ncbi:MAG TPA: LuxR C-terminal-related transcriptional regulator [Hyphomicrobiaceae bacterium]|nr:LuxR C-terminal-related transcriptional regulator [Hyphomicrobiaceae bacterium]